MDPKVLIDVIPKYLRDGWQVVSAGDRKKNTSHLLLSERMSMQLGIMPTV